MELKVAEESLGLAPISAIKHQLDRIFGTGMWGQWELETFSIELGSVLDELLRDKITVLQVLEANNKLFYDNPLFFLHASEVINNKVADFEALPYPTSLELAYAIYEIHKIYPGEFEYPVKKVITYALKNEGYSKPVGLFKNIVYAGPCFYV